MALSYGTSGVFLPITVVTFCAFGERGALEFGCAMHASVNNLRLEGRVCSRFDRLHTRAVYPRLVPQENAVAHDAHMSNLELLYE